MAYIFRFRDNDRIVNLVKTNPEVSFYFYSGSAYLNSDYAHSGAFSSSILGVDTGYLSLYEQNIDRSGTVDFSNTTVLTAQAPAARDPFGYAVQNMDTVSPVDYYTGPNPSTVTFKVKDGTRVNFKTVSKAEFNLEPGGNPMFEAGALSASVQKYYYADNSLKASGSYQNTGRRSRSSGPCRFSWLRLSCGCSSV
jgi:hypothetical protein